MQDKLNVNYLLRIYILSLSLQTNEKKSVRCGNKSITCERISDSDIYIVSSKNSEITLNLTDYGIKILKYNKIEQLNKCTQRAVQSYLYSMFEKTDILRRLKNV